MKISICMATYNGQTYIKKQIESILCQLSDNDELLISDDGSKDDTIKIINSFRDSRIRLIEGPKSGCVMNFEHAIKSSKGDIIMLSDQDDIWRPNKIDTIRSILLKEESIDLVCHNYGMIDANGLIIQDKVKKDVKIDFWSNLKKPKLFTGNSMAFRSDKKSLILPIPKNKYVYHDNWIGLTLLKNRSKSVYYIDEPLVLYRRHYNNVSVSKSNVSILQRIFRRIILLYYLYK